MDRIKNIYKKMPFISLGYFLISSTYQKKNDTAYIASKFSINMSLFSLFTTHLSHSHRTVLILSVATVPKKKNSHLFPK